MTELKEVMKVGPNPKRLVSLQEVEMWAQEEGSHLHDKEKGLE